MSHLCSSHRSVSVCHCLPQSDPNPSSQRRKAASLILFLVHSQNSRDKSAIHFLWGLGFISGSYHVRITFLPRYLSYSSYRAIIHDTREKRSIRLSQLAQVVESFGPIGTINSLDVHQLKHHFLLVSDASGDNDGCRSEDEQHRSSARNNTRWDEIDEQRLRVYKEEGKPWKWIFKKFPNRTKPAIRTRWTIIQNRSE